MTKEEEILLAAEEEFFRNGYDATSTAVIAKRAGVTHAMVNYYFRNKEKLFIQILDNQVNELLQSLKPVMHADGDIIEVSTEAASVIFDMMNSKRRLPYLISDISRNHPEFLLRYKETFDTICKDSVRMHSQRLGQHIADGKVSECTMNDIYNTILTLATMPFLSIPLLENVAGLSPDDIDGFLHSRKAEMVRIIKARYSLKKD